MRAGFISELAFPRIGWVMADGVLSHWSKIYDMEMLDNKPSLFHFVVIMEN